MTLHLVIEDWLLYWALVIWCAGLCLSLVLGLGDGDFQFSADLKRWQRCVAFVLVLALHVVAWPFRLREIARVF